MPKSLPARIGRFNVLKELGKGSQGIVYLAVDPQLDRQVAIKTIHLRPSRDGSQQRRIMAEARTVSKLQHPNIIPVYEAGEYDHNPYVVFEFVDGVSLRDLIGNNGGLAVHRAVNLMRQILDGIAYAHEQGIIHRDLSPSNVLVNKNDTPRIMDFGISTSAGAVAGKSTELSGTPCYMSPEHFSNKPMGPPADIFSLGLVFYEMLTGKPAIQAENEYAAMYKIAHEPLPPPSTKNPKVDPKLDAVVLKALVRDTGKRYAAASDMKKDLDTYLDLQAAAKPGQPPGALENGTLEFLLRRMRHKSDFPTFSQYIAEINQKASVQGKNSTSASKLADVIIKDHALTNKLLKLVNSAFYGISSGPVTTVSRAVSILGFEQVRLASASLMLFEHLQNQSQRVDLQDAAVSSLMSALIAKEKARDEGLRATEEVFICAMLHNLGKHLVIFYFSDEYDEIKNLIAVKALEEMEACQAVLGISYDEIGSGVARTWKFPDKIVQSMRRTPRVRLEPPASEEDRIWLLSAFSNELSQIAGTGGNEQGQSTLSSLLERYEECLRVDRDSAFYLLNVARERLGSYSEIFGINPKESPFLSRVENFCSVGESELLQGAGESREPGTGDSDGAERETSGSAEALGSPDEAGHPDTVLLSGIQDITNILLKQYELNDVMTLILETLHKGFRFHRVLLCLRDKRKSEMVARLGFGDNIDRIIDGFHFPVSNKSPDVFNLSLGSGKDLAIHDAGAPRIRRGLPEWYLKLVAAPAFVLCPILVNDVSLGLIYADRDRIGEVVSAGQMNYLKTLCNQAVLAMTQTSLKP